MTVAAVHYQPPFKLGNAALRSRKHRDGFASLGNGNIALGETEVPPDFQLIFRLSR